MVKKIIIVLTLLATSCASSIRDARELGRCDVVCWMSNPSIKTHAKSAAKDADGRTGCECVEGAAE